MARISPPCRRGPEGGKHGGGAETSPLPLALLPFLVFQRFLVACQAEGWVQQSRERPGLRAVQGLFVCAPSTKIATCARAGERK